MSTVEIKCPRCGSSTTPKNKEKNEYECLHCNSTFRFIDPTHSTVLQDTVVHHCPICGEPVRSDASYICSKCGKEWLCRNCVNKFQGKYTCNDCLTDIYLVPGFQKVCPVCGSDLRRAFNTDKTYSFYCSQCGKYVRNTCPKCKSKMEYIAQHGEFWCQTCQAYPRYQQPKSICCRCNGQLTFISQYQRWYCYKCKQYQ
jgi:hypothetical protein